MMKVKLSGWFVSYYGEMHSYVAAKTYDAAVANDILQETFLAAIESLPGFNNDSNPKTWLYAILNKKVADHYRKIKKMPMDEMAMDNDLAAPAQIQLLDDPDFLHYYKRALASLPRMWRKMLADRYIYNKSSAQICAHYCISKENYWQIMRRAKLMIKEKLDSFSFY